MKTNQLILLLVFLGFVAVVGFYITKDNKLIDNKHEDEPIESYEIHPSDVVEKLRNNEDIILLDVRTPREFAEIHLKNALLLPVEELSQESLLGIGLDIKDREIIIYCRSGARSKVAYDIMNSLGYTNIKSVAGGMIHWQEDNYPFTEVGEYNEDLNKSTKENISTGAQISFNKSLHDFGDIPKSGGKVKTIFEVKNTGSEILIIGKLSTSCGCTTATISENNILPNKSAELSVIFDPNFHPEPQEKITRTVFIPSNDPLNREAEIRIMVDILEDK